MTKILSKLCIMLCAVLTISCVYAPAALAESDTDQSASVTILLADPQDKKPISNMEICMYKVAEFTDFKNHKFKSDNRFEDIIHSLNFSDTESTCTYSNTMKLLEFVKKNGIAPDTAKVSNEQGKGVFQDLQYGIYLADIPDCDKFEVNSFIVEIPLCENGDVYYNFVASPKLLKDNDSSKPVDESSYSESSSNMDSSELDSSNDSSRGSVNSSNENSYPVNTSKTDGGNSPNTGSLQIRITLAVILVITLAVLAYANVCFNGKNKNSKTK